MNLEHLSSRMKLDMRHLQWQSRMEHLSEEQKHRRFEALAEGYCDQVPPQDRKEVEALSRQYQRLFDL